MSLEAPSSYRSTTEATKYDEYLGDGVYASFDGWQIWLDTRAQNPVNRIALDQNTFDALNRYVTRLRSKRPE